MAGRVVAHVAQQAADAAGELERDGQATATLLDTIAQARETFAPALRGGPLDPPP
jgi:Flp pilus assembly protein TadG